ncbi:MMPL family transporter [Nocardia caishijiensis]|uniref:RND superfamily putative drug exporter n=1 Tax=Nocardia caishijiensis TaxID=184756 RepID=A0ABQ6YLR0_9NOCA|nr:MMPL family transporter [Nocardia caishijiensis]KAF0846722.1 RND superfamily putative drug exporter [Nocardia caishijiensis]
MTALARCIAARPRTVLAAILVFIGLCAAYGATVTERLSAGGFVDGGSESALVDRFVTERLGPQSPDVVALYTAPEGRTIDEIGPQVRAALDRIDPALLARPVESYWSAVVPRKNFLVSEDREHAVAVVYTAGDDTARIAAFPAIAEALQVPGVDTRLSGYSALNAEIIDRSQRDLVVAESISLPLTLLVLVLVFGGVAAGALPVVVGLLAVGGALGAIRLLTEVTEVTTFAVNIASLLGLGMAIDYGLFLVNRFREEYAARGDVDAAVVRTMTSAGRTVAVSAALLVCAFAGTFVFPQAVLRSLGIGAVAAVALAATLSLTVLPALLVLFGARIGRAKPTTRTEQFWGRVVDTVLRRPGTVTIAVTAILLVLAAPLVGIRLGEIDHRALPADSPLRHTVEELTARFPAASSGATVLLRGLDGPPQSAAVSGSIAAIEAVPGVEDVVQVGRDDDFVVLHAFLTRADRSEEATDAVRAIRALPAPGPTVVEVGGDTAATLDSVDATVDRLPLMIAVMVLVTMVLLTVAFRSVILPLKAVVMAFLSLAATFGVLTWIFVGGQGASLLGVSHGPLPAGMTVLIIAVVFGLSTDYEVFLLSRMAEAHRAGADTATAVRLGTVRTARVITAAAVLLVLVTGAFALSPLTPMRLLGVGMIVALILDATLVRMLLVPALVQLMGPANWWYPGLSWRRGHHG